MEYIIKLSAICVVGSAFSLLIKKTNPEIALLIGTGTVLLCAFYVVPIYNDIIEKIHHWESLVLLDPKYFIPLIKCLGISIISQFGMNICKDAGQSAVALGLEICSNAACAVCMLPLIDYLFTVLNELL